MCLGGTNSLLRLKAVAGDNVEVASGNKSAATNSMRHVLSYVRHRRRSLDVTQQELATLLGRVCRSHLSKLERGKRLPSLGVAIACEVLFGEQIDQLFPDLYRQIAEEVIGQLRKFLLSIDAGTSPRRMRTKQLIEEALARISNP